MGAAQKRRGEGGWEVRDVIRTEWRCAKHFASGSSEDGCSMCAQDAVDHDRELADLRARLAAAESARDAAEAAYSACKASLDRQTAIADECAEEAQKYLAERDAALADAERCRAAIERLLATEGRNCDAEWGALSAALRSPVKP
jgi:chromosome segregation ATPase